MDVGRPGFRGRLGDRLYSQAARSARSARSGRFKVSVCHSEPGTTLRWQQRAKTFVYPSHALSLLPLGEYVFSLLAQRVIPAQAGIQAGPLDSRLRTTHLQNLLTVDDRFAFANFYQVSFPRTFF